MLFIPFAEVRGLEIMYFCFLFMFFFEFLCFSCFVASFCLNMFSPSLFKFLHLQSTTHTHINTYTHNIKTQRKTSTNKTKKTQKSPSQTLRYIYFSWRFVGWKSCISVCFMFFFEFVCCCSVSFCFFLFFF